MYMGTIKKYEIQRRDLLRMWLRLYACEALVSTKKKKDYMTKS
jgi:hypothetical protein